MLIEWVTLSEINNDYFLVEHSTNGKEFNMIGSLDGNNNSNSKIDYHFLHQNPANGNNYYRLKQLDLNGEYEYSPIRLVNFKNTEAVKSSFVVYPNPNNGNEIYINGKNISLKNTEVKIFNAIGSLVYEKKIDFETSYKIKPEPSLLPGVYFVTINNEIYLFTVNTP